MSEQAPRVRLRQAVIAAAELAPVEQALREALGLGEPFRDPGVGEFGLHNAVFALGDCFLEVISPTQPGTAVGRWLQRHGGDGGYMAIFDLEDLDGARARVAERGIRVVWQIDLPDISGTHLHPADMRGAIVSLDRSLPYGSWRWGGPEWIGRTGEGAPGRLAGITVAAPDPVDVSARWGEVLGVAPGKPDEDTTLVLDNACVDFAKASADRAEGILDFDFAEAPTLADAGDGVIVGGVRLRATGQS